MITAQVASIPDREQLLEQTVKSLLPQVDKLNIMLNYSYTPGFLRNLSLEIAPEKLNWWYFDNSKGDAAKFYGLKDVKGYIFTCDDDLVYPPDYVETMINELKKHENKVILTHHGRIMNEKPVFSSYSDRKAAFHWRDRQLESIQLDIGGTGVMAWHSDAFFPDIDRINIKNMADIWVAKFAKEQGVKIMLCPHKEDYLKYLHTKNTIWDEHYPNPGVQTDLYNSF